MNGPRDLWTRLQGALRLQRALRLIWESTPGLTIASLALTVLEAGLPLLGLYLTKLVVDAVASAIGQPAPDPGPVLLLIGLAAGVTLLAAAARSVSSYVSEAQTHTVTDHVQGILHAKAVEVDLAYYEDPQYHDTLHRAQQEASYRPPRILAGILHLVQAVLTTAGVATLLALVHPALILLLVVAVAPGLWLRVRNARKLNEWQWRRASAERRSYYLDWLLLDRAHAKEVRVFGLAPYLMERFRSLRELLRGERLKIARWRTWTEFVIQALAACAVFGSLAIIALMALRGDLTLGDLVMYFGAVQRGQAALQQMTGALTGLYEDNLFLDSVDRFLSLQPTVTSPGRPRPAPERMTDALALEGVSFSYDADTPPLLRDVNLRVGRGEIVALVGENGSGKTTLVKLIARLYDPLAGRVTLDGVDIREIDLARFRRQVAVVFQDYARYEMTARDNIWMGAVHSPPDEQRIRDAARAAGADSVIDRLTEGYDTMLGRWFEAGQELSTGQWQRIALARAFASDAQLLVFDEPTSALDPNAEAAVIEELRQTLGDRAAIVITHRYSSTRMADRIYVLSEGEVVESGSNAELMRQDGPYRRLFAHQAGDLMRALL